MSPLIQVDLEILDEETYQLYSMAIQRRSIIWRITSRRKNLTTDFLFMWSVVSCLPECMAKMNRSILCVDAVINYCLPLEHCQRLDITVDCCRTVYVPFWFCGAGPRSCTFPTVPVPQTGAGPTPTYSSHSMLIAHSITIKAKVIPYEITTKRHGKDQGCMMND